MDPATGQAADPAAARPWRASSHLRLVATLLAMPAEGALEALREVLPQAPWLAEAVGELESLPLEHWQAEHTRLFINGYPETPCPPFESAYRQGRMGGPCAGDLQGLYRRAGLQTSGAPADYLGTLLECAAYLGGLCHDRGQCPAAELLAELWESHLNHWLSRFASDLGGAARLKLYQVLAGQLVLLGPEPAHES